MHVSVDDGLEEILELEAALVRLRLCRAACHCVDTLERARGEVGQLRPEQAMQYGVALAGVDRLRALLAGEGEHGSVAG